jgi:hypothetical protein
MAAEGRVILAEMSLKGSRQVRLQGIRPGDYGLSIETPRNEPSGWQALREIHLAPGDDRTEVFDVVDELDREGLGALQIVVPFDAGGTPQKMDVVAMTKKDVPFGVRAVTSLFAQGFTRDEQAAGMSTWVRGVPPGEYSLTMLPQLSHCDVQIQAGSSTTIRIPEVEMAEAHIALRVRGENLLAFPELSVERAVGGFPSECTEAHADHETRTYILKCGTGPVRIRMPANFEPTDDVAVLRSGVQDIVIDLHRLPKPQKLHVRALEAGVEVPLPIQWWLQSSRLVSIEGGGAVVGMGGEGPPQIGRRETMDIGQAIYLVSRPGRYELHCAELPAFEKIPDVTIDIVEGEEKFVDLELIPN